MSPAALAHTDCLKRRGYRPAVGQPAIPHGIQWNVLSARSRLEHHSHRRGSQGVGLWPYLLYWARSTPAVSKRDQLTLVPQRPTLPDSTVKPLDPFPTGWYLHGQGPKSPLRSLYSGPV